MFSPYYAWARRRHGDAGAPAEAHCALNLSLYRRPPGHTRFERLWAMTERSAAQLHRGADHLQIGHSRLAWSASGALHIDVDEWTAPWPRRLLGHVRLQPQQLPGRVFALDAAGRHCWQPIAPRARVELGFEAPHLRWAGDAYLDANHGMRPLARDFDSWQWSRSALPATAWGLARGCRAVQPPELLATLESGPFYSRSLLRDAADGSVSVHESLSLRRFAQPWVQAMLPFRMPRWTRSA